MTMFFAKKLNKKGFTLAELLIVVAIIAVLVAIAVPIFTNSLEKSRYAVHSSNGRALKSLAVSALLGSDEFASQTLSQQNLWIASGTYDFKTETMTLDAITALTTTTGSTALKPGMWMKEGKETLLPAALAGFTKGKYLSNTNKGTENPATEWMRFQPDDKGYKTIGRVGTGTSVQVSYIIVFTNIDVTNAQISIA